MRRSSMSANSRRANPYTRSIVSAGQAERVAFGVGEHHPGVAGLELRFAGTEFERALDAFRQVGYAQVQMGVLGRVGPAGGPVAVDALEAELDRAFAEGAEVVVLVAGRPAGELGVERGQLGRVGGVDDDRGEGRGCVHFAALLFSLLS